MSRPSVVNRRLPDTRSRVVEKGRWGKLRRKVQSLLTGLYGLARIIFA